MNSRFKIFLLLFGLLIIGLWIWFGQERKPNPTIAMIDAEGLSAVQIDSILMNYNFQYEAPILPTQYKIHLSTNGPGYYSVFEVKILRQLQHVLTEMDQHKTKRGRHILKDIFVLQAIHWANLAWAETYETIIWKLKTT